MATSEEAEGWQELFFDWQKDYKIGEFLENTPENWEKVQELDTHLVWTSHGTCEDPQITSGASMYNGKCCWETYGWYMAEVPWEEWDSGPESTYISVRTAVYLPCPTCNPDGENDDGAEDCPGDENEEIENNGCEFGYIQYYFD